MKELTIGIFPKKTYESESFMFHRPRVILVHDPIIIDYNALALEEHGVLISYADDLNYEIKDGKIIFK